jgi:hypothetical protein
LLRAYANRVRGEADVAGLIEHIERLARVRALSDALWYAHERLVKRRGGR